MSQKTQADGTIKFFITIIGLVIVGIVLRELSHIFIPLVIAIFLFFVFSPLNNWLDNKKIPMMFITLFNLAIIFGLLYGVGRIIVDSFLQFGEGLPIYGEKLSNMVRATSISWGVTDPFFTQFSFDQLLAKLNIQNLAGGIFSSTVSLLGNILFVLFFFLFVLSGNETIYNAIKRRYVFKKVSPEIKEIKENIENSTATADDQKLLDKFHNEKDVNSSLKQLLKR